MGCKICTWAVTSILQTTYWPALSKNRKQLTNWTKTDNLTRNKMTYIIGHLESLQPRTSRNLIDQVGQQPARTFRANVYFSINSLFSYTGCLSQQVVLTTLLVACSTSFVLNAYNFLFLKRFAIYVWFAIAPLIWVVCPLTGAAWVTKTYLRYKLVVVNAWVDIPEVCYGWRLFSKMR